MGPGRQAACQSASPLTAAVSNRPLLISAAVDSAAASFHLARVMRMAFAALAGRSLSLALILGDAADDASGNDKRKTRKTRSCLEAWLF